MKRKLLVFTALTLSVVAGSSFALAKLENKQLVDLGEARTLKVEGCQATRGDTKSRPKVIDLSVLKQKFTPKTRSK